VIATQDPGTDVDNVLKRKVLPEQQRYQSGGAFQNPGVEQSRRFLKSCRGFQPADDVLSQHRQTLLCLRNAAEYCKGIPSEVASWRLGRIGERGDPSREKSFVIDWKRYDDKGAEFDEFERYNDHNLWYAACDAKLDLLDSTVCECLVAESNADIVAVHELTIGGVDVCLDAHGHVFSNIGRHQSVI